MAAQDTNIFINEILETGTDSGDGLTFEFYVTSLGTIMDSSVVGYTFADPLVYINGVLQVAGYTVNADDITFAVDQTGNEITMTYTWEITDFEDTTVYKFIEPPNMTVEQDINTKRKITIAADKTQIYMGNLGWEYLTETQFAILLHIYRTEDTTFDIERPSFTAGFEFKYISRLMIVNHEGIEGIPGVPNCYHGTIEVAQVESV